MGEGTVDDGEVLCVDVLLEADAVLAVETVLDELVLEVEFVENCVSIGAFTGSKGNYLEVLSSSFEETEGVWPDRHIPLFSFIRDLYLQIIFTIALEIAMEKGLIQIEDEHLLAEVLLLLRKEHLFPWDHRLIG